jgi:membrane protein
VKPKSNWFKYIQDRLLSLLLVIGLGFLMLVTILLNLLIDLLSNRIEYYFGKVQVVLLKLANFSLLFIIVTLVFTIIFKVLPDAWIRWKDALIGALFTSVLFLIGKFLISYYLGLSMGINAYGAATSIILVLSWVYYSSLILYFGAGFTKCYAIKCGGGIIGSNKTIPIIKLNGLVLPKM